MDISQQSATNPATNPAKSAQPKQSTGLKRNTIDKYYTKPEVVDMCLALVGAHIPISDDDLTVEPSAGDGSFIAGIRESFKGCFKFYDLAPENSEITKQDYLQYDYADDFAEFGKIHVIGNPPFGRQSSMAIKFIKKSCEYCSSVSFILPKSFKKDSLRKSFPRNFHLLYETDLPDKSFLVDGVEHGVPCIFQIWEKLETTRAVAEKLFPVNFEFVAQSAAPDISFRRVGVNAGAIDTTTDEKSTQSHYFIKFTNNKSVDDNLRQLARVTYDFNNTVGPRSISKQELIFKFNPLLDY